MTQSGTAFKMPWSVLSDYRCFGCSPHNPCGIQLEFEPHPEGIRTSFRLGRRYESYPGVVHGGMIGVICDETMGNLIVLEHRQSAFTVSLRLRYISPLLVDSPYQCVASLCDDASEGRFRGTAEIADASGELMASATAVYQAFTLDQADHQLDLSAGDKALLTEALSRDIPRNGG
jgi:acyl-coenzyme A thioesterase PaaI-like protein